LVWAIARGTNWICPSEKLARLGQLVWTQGESRQIESWIQQWKRDSASINPKWYPEDKPTFSVLQYDALTAEQLTEKLAQLPTGMRLRWQFWQAGEISPPVSMARQEEYYSRMRAVAAQYGVVLDRFDNP